MLVKRLSEYPCDELVGGYVWSDGVWSDGAMRTAAGRWWGRVFAQALSHPTYQIMVVYTTSPAALSWSAGCKLDVCIFPDVRIGETMYLPAYMHVLRKRASIRGIPHVQPPPNLDQGL